MTNKVSFFFQKPWIESRAGVLLGTGQARAVPVAAGEWPYISSAPFLLFFKTQAASRVVWLNTLTIVCLGEL